MMMLPGMTDSPPYFLTPRRRPALSRPLRDEPPAFLCAIWSLLKAFCAEPTLPAKVKTRKTYHYHKGPAPSPADQGAARNTLAFGQFLGLFDPAFALDTAFEGQFLVHLGHVCVAPLGNLGKARNTVLVQLLLQRR